MERLWKWLKESGIANRFVFIRM
ncbi:hypothetical protein [Geobacillus stearothermophilus]